MQKEVLIVLILGFYGCLDNVDNVTFSWAKTFEIVLRTGYSFLTKVESHSTQSM